MLINIDDFTKITTVTHEKEFNAWKKKLTIEEFKSIEDYINKEIDDFLRKSYKGGWTYLNGKYKGKDISIYIDCKNNINNGDFKTLIDPNQDFVTAKWDYFWHNDWILLN